MAYTRAKLVRSVAERLDLCGDGQALAATNAAVIEDGLPGIVSDMIGRGVLESVNLDAIEDEIYPHLGAVVASEIADRFMVDDALVSRLAARSVVAEQRLRVISHMPFAGTTTKVCFY